MRFYANRFSIGAAKFDENFKLDLQAILEHRHVPDVAATPTLLFWKRNLRYEGGGSEGSGNGRETANSSVPSIDVAEGLPPTTDATIGQSIVVGDVEADEVSRGDVSKDDCTASATTSDLAAVECRVSCQCRSEQVYLDYLDLLRPYSGYLCSHM